MTDNNINLYLTIDMWRFRAIYFLIPILFVVPLMIADETASPAIDENTPPEVLLPLAENGDAVAQYFLALAYVHEKGVEQNYDLAFQWFSKSAEQGHAEAQFNLGVFYDLGVGIDAELSAMVRGYLAAKWYRKAAEQGLPEALCNLGNCYRSGIGVNQNIQEAIKLYRKAAEQGCAIAQHNLGFCYFNGFGVDKNEQEAIEWFRKAAEQGHAEAQNNLGLCYQNGTGVEVDFSEAVKWYHKAAEQEIAVAQNNLGGCYAKGMGVVQNDQEATMWFRKAAEQGFPDAQYTLACRYVLGRGVDKDESEAVRWFKKAAEQGHTDAQKDLELLELHKIPESMPSQNRGDRARKLGEGLGQMTITGYLCSVIIAAFFRTIRRWLTGKHTPFWRATGFCLMFYFALCTVCVGLLTFLILPAMNANPNPEPVWFRVFTVGTTLFYGIGLGACVLKFLDVDWKNLRFGQKIMTVLAFIVFSFAVMVVTVIVLGILFATLPG